MASSSTGAPGDDHDSETTRAGAGAPPPTTNGTQTTPHTTPPKRALPGLVEAFVVVFTTPWKTLFPPNPASDTLPLIAAQANRRAWRARKMLLKALVVSLSCLILLLEPVTLKTLGNAAFFAVLVSTMVPPTMPAMMFMLAMSTMVFGMLVGWAWSSAAMAAAVKARSQVLLASQTQRVAASVAGATNPESLYQVSIFKGEFLDARATVVFGVFLFVGTFVLGLLKAKAPKLALFAIFGCIVMDVMCSYGPLFPFAEYTLASSFLLPVSFFLAIGTAANFLLFPETLNRGWTNDLVDNFLTPILQRSQLHSTLLTKPPPAVDRDVWSSTHQQFLGLAAKLSGGAEALLGSIAMMELEVSRGRMSAKDLGGLAGGMRQLLARSMGLGVFCHLIENRAKRFSNLAPTDEHDSLDEKPDKTWPAPSGNEKVTPRMHRLRSRIIQSEATHSHDLGSLLPILESASAPLRTAGDDALLGAMTWLAETNKARWHKVDAKKVEEDYQVQKKRIDVLETALEEYRATGRQKLYEPFKDRFDEKGELLPVENGEQLNFSPSSLFLCFTASHQLVKYAEGLLSFLRTLSELEHKRRVNKVWWSTGLRKVGHLVRGKKGAGVTPGEAINPSEVEVVGDGEEADAKTLVDEEQKEQKEVESPLMDPDAKPPKNGVQRLTLKLHNFGLWLRTAETIYALKFATISVLLWLPQVFPQSAYFCYSEKGLWALIMAQTGLAVYQGDFIGTSLPVLLNARPLRQAFFLIWYIGAGHGYGSKIGIGASFTILMIIPLAIRLYGPPQYLQGCMIGCVTVVLIVGYSWSNGHQVTLGSIGIGISIAWRRALLVIIGTAAAAILMLFPSPQSSRKLVRFTQATTISTLSSLYSIVTSGWINNSLTPAKQALARAKFLDLLVKLKALKLFIASAGMEFSLRGDWPGEEYGELLEAQLGVLEALSLLGVALVGLDEEWRKVLVHKTAFLNPNLVGEVLVVFSSISMALKLGQPLPPKITGPLLDRLLYHEELRKSPSTQIQKALGADGGSDGHVEEHTVEGAAIGTRLTFDILKDERFGTHATAILALSAILSGLDEMDAITRRLVGEVKFPVASEQWESVGKIA
ncbi:hypothetical protein MNV49_007401 [Pseudohyphozyma bogoriensis]|nr:hypothetical protein MNV49_007401 [Pseudohyphozyma bogoriensis]